MSERQVQEMVAPEPSFDHSTEEYEPTPSSHLATSSLEQEPHWESARLSLNGVVEEFLQLYPYHNVQNGPRTKRLNLNLGTYDCSPRRALLEHGSDTQVNEGQDENTSTRIQRYSESLSEIKDALASGQLHRGWDLLGVLIKSVFKNKTYCGVTPLNGQYASQLEAEIDSLNFHLAFALGCTPHVPFLQNSRICLWVAGISKSGDIHHQFQKELFLMIRNLTRLDFTRANDILAFLNLSRTFSKPSSFGILDRLRSEVPADGNYPTLQMRLHAYAILFVVSCRVASICGYYAGQTSRTRKLDDDLKEFITEQNLKSPSRKHETYCKTVEYAGKTLEAFCALCQSYKTQVPQDWINYHPAMVAAMVVVIAEARKSKWKISRMLQTLRAVENLFRGLGDPSIKAEQIDDAIQKIRSMSKDTVSPYTLITSQEDASAAENEKQSKATTIQRKRKRDKEVWVTLKNRKHSDPGLKKINKVKPLSQDGVLNKVSPDRIHKSSPDQKNGSQFAPLDLLLEAGDRSGPC